jgi:bifunctional DNA-binding transcriptional regulator/antitoxin component of YhaV-PrlF toxin-antitoxin module
MEEVFRAKLNREGRLIIPVPCRKRTGLEPGQEVMLQVTPDGLLVTTLDQSLKRFQDQVTSLVGPDVSLVDEVIEDRRAEAKKEVGE